MALHAEAADGVGPFATGSRVRNAQRQAFRGALPPTMAAGNTFMFSGVGTSTFRVQEFGNVMTGTAFDLDVFPYTDPINDANGVDDTGADLAPPQDINIMPWGWSLLP